jgi:hypothetical protein
LGSAGSAGGIRPGVAFFRFGLRFLPGSICGGRGFSTTITTATLVMAFGGYIYAEAIKHGKGRAISTDWFLQDIRD